MEKQTTSEIKAKRSWASNENIITIIKEDHKPLKELIAIMKDIDQSPDDRIEAFKNFMPLLITHAKAEEQSLYEFMKTQNELREFAFEGEAEHSVADQLCEEIERTTDNDQILARIKVLAESVEHHIREEENNILPNVEKHLDQNTLLELSEDYTDFQDEIISEGQDNSPHEDEMARPGLEH